MNYRTENSRKKETKKNESIILILIYGKKKQPLVLSVR